MILPDLFCILLAGVLLKCSFVLYRDGSMSRRSNAATGKDLLKTFRGNLSAVEAGDALLSLDGFCKKHSVLMKEILSITSRRRLQLSYRALCGQGLQPWS